MDFEVIADIEDILEIPNREANHVGTVIGCRSMRFRCQVFVMPAAAHVVGLVHLVSTGQVIHVQSVIGAGGKCAKPGVWGRGSIQIGVSPAIVVEELVDLLSMGWHSGE